MSVNKHYNCFCIVGLILCVSLLAGLLGACGRDHASEGTTALPSITVTPDTTSPTQAAISDESSLQIEATIPQLDCPEDGSRVFYLLFGNDNFYKIKDSVTSDVVQVQDDTLKLKVECVITDLHVIGIIFSLEHLGGEDISELADCIDWKFDFVFADDSSPDQRYFGAQSITDLPCWDPETAAALDALDPETANSRIYYYARLDSTGSAIDSVVLNVSSIYDYENPENRVDTDLTVEIPLYSCPVATGEDISGRFEDISLSPVGLWVDTDEQSETAVYFDITLQYRNGTTFTVTAQEFAEGTTFDQYGWYKPVDFSDHIMIEFMREFIDPSEVEAIILDGVEIPISVP